MLGHRQWNGGALAIVAMVAVLVFAVLIGVGRAEDQEGMRFAGEQLTEFIRAEVEKDIPVLEIFLHRKLNSYDRMSTVSFSLEAFRTLQQSFYEKGKLSHPPDERLLTAFFVCLDEQGGIQNTFYVSSGYPDRARELKEDPDEYFQRLLFHELVHWAMCQTRGPYRFNLGHAADGEFMPHLLRGEEDKAKELTERFLWNRRMQKNSPR